MTATPAESRSSPTSSRYAAPPPNKPREFVLQSAVDAVEGVLETGSRLAVDLADGLLERVQGIRKVGELPVEVLLALGLLLQLVDRRQVDGAETLDPFGDFHELLIPREDGRILGERGRHPLEIELGRRKLLDQRLAADTRLLHAETDLRERRARGFRSAFRFLPHQVQVAHDRVRFLDGPPRVAEFALNRQPLFQEGLQLAFELRERRLALRELALEVRAAFQQLARLIARPLEARAQGGERRTL